MVEKQFPENFLWGAATSSHQIEGYNTNQWTRWEKKNASRLAKTAEQKINSEKETGRRTPDWDKVSGEATEPENYISGKATNHKERFPEDIQIASDLNLDVYRFSIEWSRIEPEKGEIDEEAIDFYHKLLDELEKHEIEPFVTLHHFTNPKWFADEGGFAARNPSDWDKYIQTIAEEFGERVDNWITVNEPNVYALNSFLVGRWPPAKKNPVKYLRVLNNMAEFHRDAYEVLEGKDTVIGVSSSTMFFDSAGGLLNDFLASKSADHWNHRFVEDIMPQLDFIGVNFYNRRKVDRGFYGNGFEKTSDVGWEIYPEGVYHVLKEMDRYDLPIFITENGLADSEDEYREDYLKQVLSHCHQAIEDGVDLQGYMHWSLLDNFEWDSGFWPRFGLVEVDYDTYERKIRESAETYAKITGQNYLDIDEDQD